MNTHRGPGRIVATRLAIMSDGDMAEVVLDSTKSVYCRWRSGETWSDWQGVGSGAVDIEIAAAVINGADEVRIVLTPGVGYAGAAVAARRIFTYNRSGQLAGTNH